MKQDTATLKTLKALLLKGTVWIEDDEYLGRASDGVVISLGVVGHESGAERYLRANPIPDKW